MRVPTCTTFLDFSRRILFKGRLKFSEKSDEFDESDESDESDENLAFLDKIVKIF